MNKKLITFDIITKHIAFHVSRRINPDKEVKRIYKLITGKDIKVLHNVIDWYDEGDFENFEVDLPLNAYGDSPKPKCDHVHFHIFIAPPNFTDWTPERFNNGMTLQEIRQAIYDMNLMNYPEQPLNT